MHTYVYIDMHVRVCACMYLYIYALIVYTFIQIYIHIPACCVSSCCPRRLHSFRHRQINYRRLQVYRYIDHERLRQRQVLLGGQDML